MYGIVNKAIEDLVITSFGETKWDTIKLRSGIDIDFFISNESYDDEITYILANATAAEIGIPVSEIFQALGEWWVLKIAKEKYGGLMMAGGKNLKEFLINLPVFHNRIMMMYPKLTPPEFRISNIEENSLQVHYFSKRDGLGEFVRGLLFGLGKMYNAPLKISLLQSRDEGHSHEIFKLIW